MNYTIENLFDAIYYCNKFVKLSQTIKSDERSNFYKIKQRIIYHLIKCSNEFNIIINDCHIDKQFSNDGKEISLYSFELKCNNTTLLVHQKYYAKLKELIKYKNIEFSEDGEYKMEEDDNLIISDELYNGNMIVIEYFYHKWNL